MNKLKQLRKAAGLTQQQLADRSDVHLMTISKLERGVADIGNITLANATKLASALGCHAEELL